MITTLLVDSERPLLRDLQENLNAHFPQIAVKGMAFSQEEAREMIGDVHPDLLFIDKDLARLMHKQLLEWEDEQLTTILLSSDPQSYSASFDLGAFGFLAKPIQTNDLLMTVSQAQHLVRLRQEQRAQRALLSQMAQRVCSNNIVGIPTTDGIDFLKAEDIVRCEGLQKHTLIVTVAYEFISSYNIGEFRKILQPHGFFSTHKSHLVNLKHIRKLNNEGSICMDDGSYVPLSRRRRRSFLDEVRQM